MNLDIWQLLVFFALATIFWLFVQYLFKQNTNPVSHGIQEDFTSEDLALAQKIVDYLQSPNNFIGYANLLIANQNTSTNLANVATYNALVEKGPGVTVADVLDKF